MNKTELLHSALERYFESDNPSHKVKGGLVVKGNNQPAAKGVSEIIGICATMSSEIHVTVSDVEEQLAELEAIVNQNEREKKAENKENKELMAAEVLNEYTTHKILWWLRTAVLDDGSVRMVIRTSNSTNSYFLIKNQTGVGIVKALLGVAKPLLAQAKDALAIGFEEKKVSFMGRYKDVAPDLARYLDDNMNNIFSDDSITLDTRIESFTNDSEVPAFAHVDLARLSPITTWGEGFPTISGWLGAMLRPDQAEVLMAYLYGAMCKDFNSRQGLYLEDLVGNTGKSTFMGEYIDYLRSIDPNLVASMDTKNIKNQFAFAQFYGKRIVVDPDTQNPHILHSSVYHKITGGDMVPIEMKGQDVFSARLKCFPIMMGNISLEINTSDEHERSRIIYLKVRRLPEAYLKTQCLVDTQTGELVRDTFGATVFRGDTRFKENVRAEMGNFLGYCKVWYDYLSGGGQIRLPDSISKDMLDSARSEDEDEFDRFLEENIEFGEDKKMGLAELRHEFETGIRGITVTPALKKKFIKYVEKLDGITIRRPRLKSHENALTKRPRVVYGLGEN